MSGPLFHYTINTQCAHYLLHYLRCFDYFKSHRNINPQSLPSPSKVKRFFLVSLISNSHSLIRYPKLHVFICVNTNSGENVTWDELCPFTRSHAESMGCFPLHGHMTGMWLDGTILNTWLLWDSYLQGPFLIYCLSFCNFPSLFCRFSNLCA